MWFGSWCRNLLKSCEIYKVGTALGYTVYSQLSCKQKNIAHGITGERRGSYLPASRKFCPEIKENT